MNRIEKVKQTLEELKYPNPIALGKSKALKELKMEIFELTPFLGDEPSAVFRAYCLINGITEKPRCPECGSEVNKRQNTESGISPYDTYIFSEFCSRHCARTSSLTKTKRESTMKEIYGGHNMRTEKGQEEYRLGCLEKLGVEHPMKLTHIMEKACKTADGEWRVNTEDFREKSECTLDERYGGHWMKHEENAASVTATRKENMLERVGVCHESHITKNPHRVSEFHSDEDFTEIANRYDHAEEIAEYFEYHVSRVRARLAELGLQKSTKTSLGENELASYIESLGVVVKRNDRTVLSGREIDVLCPEHSVGFEYNGLYWHSEKFMERGYHQKKVDDAKEKGVRIINIWEDDWNKKRDLIKDKIKYILGIGESKIGARSCSIVDVPSKEAAEFYNTNHIQGNIPCTSIGLIYEGELVACLGTRRKGDGVYDLSRFATSRIVSGGFSRLLRHFQDNNEWDSIITFANRDYSEGGLYELTGFENVGTTPPNYIYYNPRYTYTLTRVQAMKHKLKDVVKNFDPELTEKENMNRDGWYRVYDSGSIKFVLNNKKSPN